MKYDEMWMAIGFFFWVLTLINILLNFIFSGHNFVSIAANIRSLNLQIIPWMYHDAVSNIIAC